MKIRSQVGMVLNLDKCIGCHTCSVTCKTSGPGAKAWSTHGLTTSKPNRALVIRKLGRSGRVARQLGPRCEWQDPSASGQQDGRNNQNLRQPGGAAD